MHKSSPAVARPAVLVLVPLCLPLGTTMMASLSHAVVHDCVATCIFMMSIHVGRNHSPLHSKSDLHYSILHAEKVGEPGDEANYHTCMM